MPTLKQFLEENGIKATPDQRSRLGRFISKPDDNNGRVREDGFKVKDYKEDFLNNEHTQMAIIFFLNNQQDNTN